MRFFFLLLCSLSTGAIAATLRVDATTMRWNPEDKSLDQSTFDSWKNGSVQMPYVRGPDKTVAARINDYLFVEWMGMPAPPQHSKTAVVTGVSQTGSPAGTTRLEFSVVRNDGKVLAIQLNAEGCGAYCEDYQTVRSFDARTGRKLSANDFLTHQGQLLVAQRRAREAKTQYQKMIATLKQKLRSTSNRKTFDRDDLVARIDLNKECLTQTGKAPVTDAEWQGSLRNVEFSPLKNGLLFVSGRCSNHAERALDDVGDINTLILNSDLARFLTPYGRYLQLSEGKPSAPTGLYDQVLRGKLGEASISLWLAEPESDGYLSGVYFYDKYRKLITVNGNATSDEINLNEYKDDEPIATFHLKRSGSKLKGDWLGKDKRLPVEAGW